MTRLAAEEKLLHQYFREPEDSVFLAVKGFAALSARVECAGGGGSASAMVLKPRFAKDAITTPSSVGFLQCKSSVGPPHAPQGDLRPVRVVLQEWGYEGLLFSRVVPTVSHLGNPRRPDHPIPIA